MRLAFYLIEAAVLTLIGTVGLGLSMNALRRLGAPARLRYGRSVLALWLILSAVGIGFGETIGPEFLFPYYFCGSMAVGGAVIWVISFFARGSIAPRSVGLR